MNNNKAKSILDFYFENTSNAMLNEKIRQWLADDYHRQEKDDALQQIWDKRIKYADKPDRYAYDSLEKMRSRLNFTKHQAVRIASPCLWRLRIVASLILYLGLSTLFSPRNGFICSERKIVTPITTTILSAEDIGQRHIVLPDSSEVWLRRDGVIAFPNDFSTERRVYLAGEAYFSVVKQDGKPFMVMGNDISVKVLGTEFYMKTGKEKLHEITLSNGSVEVMMSGKKLLMNPSDDLLYDSRTDKMFLRQVERTEIAPWKGIDLIFNNTAMQDVFRRISNYFNVSFAIDDRLVFQQTLTVAIDLDEPLEEVLYIIQNTMRDFDYSIQENNVVVITKHQ